MKGVIVVAFMLAIALMGGCSIVLANPPLVPPVQYEQFCEAQKVSGTGIIDVSTSIIDKKIALEYYNTMAGDGDMELDSEHLYSQNPEKIGRNVSSVNGGDEAGFNMIETTKMTYAGETPLTGGKYLHSKAFYGGMGAEVQEMFSVNEMEKDETAFFASTTPYRPQNVSPNGTINKSDAIDPKNLLDDGLLRDAGRNTTTVGNMMTSVAYGDTERTYVPSHLIGLETRNSFNGTWGTDAKMHKIFYKDIKAHEMFTGVFEAEKTIKFHENPVPERVRPPCDGVDC
jgi:hypothetical protein